jgi:hypothetical protein
MSEQLTSQHFDPVLTIDNDIDDDDVIEVPDATNLVTEDDTPVDNLLSEREMDLLRDSAYTSLPGLINGRRFVVMANVAIYAKGEMPPLVPDVLLSLDVELPADPWPKQNRSYMLWQYGKPPEIVVEIVSNRKGGELGNKLLDYARLGVSYYIVFDPQRYLSNKTLRIFTRRATSFVETEETWFEDIGVGVTLWHGPFRGLTATWLRWCDREGNILLTGKELADLEHQRAQQEQERAEQERQRAERLAAQLRALGIAPEA